MIDCWLLIGVNVGCWLFLILIVDFCVDVDCVFVVCCVGVGVDCIVIGVFVGVDCIGAGVFVLVSGPSTLMAPDAVIHTASAPFPNHLPFASLSVFPASVATPNCVRTLGIFCLTMSPHADLSAANFSSSVIVTGGASMNSDPAKPAFC